MINSKNLFTGARLGQLQTTNRLVVAPMTRVSALEDGCVGPLMAEYYSEFATGGFGVIITEGLYTDRHYSQGYYKQPGLSSTEQAQSWQPVIKSVQQQGAKIIAQLMHAGALSSYNRFSEHSAAPSPVQPKGRQMSLYYGSGDYNLPVAMSLSDIDNVLQGFADAARRAKEAGFDGVEIHGANGYLLDQFLTDYTNQRTDQYGGELRNRLRIYTDIVARVRAAVGDDFLVGVRFSQKKVNDSQYCWPAAENAAREIFSGIAASGIDFIHITEPYVAQSAFSDGASLVNLAKKYSGLAVIGNGGVETAEQASVAFTEQHIDFLALGKVALANPDWPNLARQGGAIKAFDPAMFRPLADLASALDYANKLSTVR
ncbi:MAG: NADH:flavin oxidoreductase / NADH oxidase family [Osedax symbiont Rs2]|nr:MAG: NADH:flavin oxidoreductase / NADH oxidase family [Osedax symbiont Rs2]